MRDDDGEISQDIGQSLLSFIEEAREDLDVQEQMSDNERASFNSALELARKEASRSVGGKRSFDVEYKSKILAELDAAKRGESKKILDREGLYYSQVSSWRKLRDQGKL